MCRTAVFRNVPQPCSRQPAAPDFSLSGLPPQILVETRRVPPPSTLQGYLDRGCLCSVCGVAFPGSLLLVFLSWADQPGSEAPGRSPVCADTCLAHGQGAGIVATGRVPPICACPGTCRRHASELTGQGPRGSYDLGASISAPRSGPPGGLLPGWVSQLAGSSCPWPVRNAISLTGSIAQSRGYFRNVLTWALGLVPGVRLAVQFSLL